jgi:hypothetical protein
MKMFDSRRFELIRKDREYAPKEFLEAYDDLVIMVEFCAQPDRALLIQTAATILAGYLADGQTSTVTSAIAQSVVDWARLIIEKVDQKP